MIELLVQMFILVWDRWLFGRQKIHPYLAVRIQTLSVTHTVASGYITNSGSVFSNEWRWRQWVRATNSIPSKKIAAQSALPIAKVTANKLEVVSHDLLSISRLGYIVCNFSYKTQLVLEIFFNLSKRAHMAGSKLPLGKHALRKKRAKQVLVTGRQTFWTSRPFQRFKKTH